MCEAPSLSPPCNDAVSYYSKFGRVAGFTSAGPGRKFRGVLEEHLALLRWPADLPEDKELSVRGEDGHLYHWILPSFFQLLQDLASQGRDFAILFRTFGTDLPRVLSVVRRALIQGTHPLFPDLPALKVGPRRKTVCSPCVNEAHHNECVGVLHSIGEGEVRCMKQSCAETVMSVLRTPTHPPIHTAHTLHSI